MTHIIYIILIIVFSFIFYVIGKYLGMKKGAEIAKKVYRELLTNNWEDIFNQAYKSK